MVENNKTHYEALHGIGVKLTRDFWVRHFFGIHSLCSGARPPHELCALCKQMMKLNRYYLQILLIIFSATPSYADAGIPMLALVLPGMIVSLVPIIIIEAWCMRRSLNISFARSVKVMGIANIESTLIGIPLTWIIWVVVEMTLAYVGYQLSASLGVKVPDFVSFAFGLTFGAAWLAPSESQGYWIVPVASLVLLVPFFYVSWLFERRRAKLLLQECLPESVNRATLKANIYSYGLLAIIVIGWLITTITKGHA